ncbi:MAG: hypothetical protein LAO23_19685 [Acidobacteriia bacterium]|nr:hypothetical protein [Terriglobia bacterium]
MIDISEIAGLLHVEEKLRVHPQWGNMLRAVRAKLDEFEAQHANQPTEPDEVEEQEQARPTGANITDRRV